MLEAEVPARLADATLSQGDELLTFGERADSDRPFLDRNRHRGGFREKLDDRNPAHPPIPRGRDGKDIDCGTRCEDSQISLLNTGFF